MERILALYDKDALYLERLSNFLRQSAELPFQVYSFREPEALRIFAGKREIDLLLSSGTEVPVAAQQTLYLSESPSVQGSPPQIYKYQSGDSILRELMLHYGDFHPSSPVPSCERSELFMIFSPIGRSGKTSLSLHFTQALSKLRKTLYLSLEEAGSFRRLFSSSPRGTLTEALYYFKEGTLDAMKLRSLCCESGGIEYIAPMRSPDDLSALSGKELSRFLRFLSLHSGYSSVVIDTDPIVSRFYDSFSLCRKVFLPIREDSVSLNKLRAFEEFLERAGAEASEKLFVKLLLPITDDQDALLGFPALRGCALSDFSEALIRHYLMPGKTAV